MVVGGAAVPQTALECGTSTRTFCRIGAGLDSIPAFPQTADSGLPAEVCLGVAAWRKPMTSGTWNLLPVGANMSPLSFQERTRFPPVCLIHTIGLRVLPGGSLPVHLAGPAAFPLYFLGTIVCDFLSI